MATSRAQPSLPCLPMCPLPLPPTPPQSLSLPVNVSPMCTVCSIVHTSRAALRTSCHAHRPFPPIRSYARLLAPHTLLAVTNSTSSSANGREVTCHLRPRSSDEPLTRTLQTSSRRASTTTSSLFSARRALARVRRRHSLHASSIFVNRSLSHRHLVLRSAVPLQRTVHLVPSFCCSLVAEFAPLQPRITDYFQARS